MIFSLTVIRQASRWCNFIIKSSNSVFIFIVKSFLQQPNIIWCRMHLFGRGNVCSLRYDNSPFSHPGLRKAIKTYCMFDELSSRLHNAIVCLHLLPMCKSSGHLKEIITGKTKKVSLIFVLMFLLLLRLMETSFFNTHSKILQYRCR